MASFASEDKDIETLVSAENAADGDGEVVVKADVAPYLVRVKETFVAFAPLGLVAFGGPAAHIGVLQEQFVEKLKWLDSDRFVELMAVGQGLPGPTSTQMVIALGATHAGIVGGIIAFMLWNVPSFIILTTFAILSKDNLDPAKMPDPLTGAAAAATSLVFIAAYKLGMKVLKKKDNEEEYVEKIKLALATFSTVLTLLITGEDSINPRYASAAFPAMLIAGGALTLFDSRREGKLGNYFQPPSADEQAENLSILKRINIHPFVGGVMIAIWLTVLGTFVGLRGAGVIGEEGFAPLFESMFRMGSIIYGGGQVVLPMLLTEVVDTGWVSEAQFLQGFSLVQILPGPLFNFSSFLGAVYLGIPGAFVAWAGLFGPGLVLVLAFLPFWMKVRQVAWFKCFLAGVNATAIGLIVAATAQLWEKAIISWADAATFFLTGSIILFFDPLDNAPRASRLWAPIGVVTGSLFGWLMTEVDFARTFN